MAESTTLFEVSWEVCNMVGGINTVISTKAQTLTERYGDSYVAVGPWLLSQSAEALPFVDEEGFEGFTEACRDAGLPVRVGRWLVPGRPRTILVDFSGLYDRKDDVLAQLWEAHQVDSISGGWDYVEPVLFGWGAGQVVERWWQERCEPKRQRGVAQFHEWTTGAGLLHLAGHAPAIGTIFTAHATVLGRALSATGRSPEDGLGEDDPAELARAHEVVAKHSLEGTCARVADVLTTTSEITAREAELFHGRAPAPLLPNGIDLDAIDELCGTGPESTPEAVRAEIARTASAFLAQDVSDAFFVAASGRYEFHNKGIDVLLEAAAALAAETGPRVVLFVLVPAGSSGLKSALKERLARLAETPPEDFDGPLGLSTHTLFDEERDAVHEACARLGLANEPGARVQVVQVPIYLGTGDGLWNRTYEAVLRAMDLTCFPSYYEPWGYTPQESLALGVPTVTTDYAGFGRWAAAQGLGVEAGVTVLPRVHRQYAEVVADLAAVLGERALAGRPDPALRERCRATAARTAWTDLITSYDAAFAAALGAVSERMKRGVPVPTRPARALAEQPVVPAAAPRLVRFEVAATLPPPLRGLERLSRNYWWCWDPEARALFEELSPAGWEAAGRNPVRFLKHVDSEHLATHAADARFVRRLERVLERFDAYLSAAPAVELAPGAGARPVAYFSAEFGVHESLRVYSGGLGVLAGDHLKSASDLGLPFVGIGLFYRRGYLTQRLSAEGEQIAVDLDNDPADLPLELVRGVDGDPLEVRVQLPGREFALRAWRANVGRVPLYLLDASTPSNRPEDRDIVRHLYGGDEKTRLLQEIVLGRGGVRLLRRLGIEPVVFHGNEGHPAFMALERVSALVRGEGLTFDEAREVVRASTAFTTHTPVPAGHDRFGEGLLRPYFSDVADWLGVPWERFFALGTSAAEPGTFNMTYLALSFASVCNGVSKLHAEASRGLLHPWWPKLLESEVPIGSVTNGIHLATWTDGGIGGLLGVEGRGVRPPDFVRGAQAIADTALWKVRRAAKVRLAARVRDSLRRSFVERHDSPLLLTRMLDGLDEDALWIGFARRFAPYKRAHLLFQDLDRLRAILDDEERPVRVLVAGKAHPRDDLGKEILKSVARLARTDGLAGRLFVLENYEMELAAALVRGVDVWLNTPTRMQEASGTSGMKAAANGALNLSIADGWWPEAADGENGWTIGAPARSYEQQDLQDQLDATTLYRMLEEEVVPLFYDRAPGGPPRRWLARVRHCLATVPAAFNTDRMVSEYAETAYRPLAARGLALVRDHHAGAKELARERRRIARGFERIQVVSARITDLADARVGDRIDVRLEVDLGELTSDDVRFELVLGVQRGATDLASPTIVTLESEGPADGGRLVYRGGFDVERSGAYAYGVRVRAHSFGDKRDTLRELVRWT